MSNGSIRVDDVRVREVLAKISAGARSPAPLFLAIGEDLVQSTRGRFVTGTAPDGSRWAANTQATFIAYLGRFSKTSNKDGRLSAKGVSVAMGKKPLVGKSRFLGSESISCHLTAKGLEVGSSAIYSAMQQFGGSKAEFPFLWGDIPARPFVGLSASDSDGIEASALAYLGDLAA